MPITITNRGATEVARTSIQKAMNAATKSTEQLSTGKAITRPSDDLVGTVIGTALEARVAVLNTCRRNVAEASSMLNVADSALAQIGDLLVQQQDIATKATNPLLTADQFTALNNQFTAITGQIDRICTYTQFNGVGLFSIDAAVTNAINSIPGFTAAANPAAVKALIDVGGAGNAGTVVVNAINAANIPGVTGAMATAAGAAASGGGGGLAQAAAISAAITAIVTAQVNAGAGSASLSVNVRAGYDANDNVALTLSRTNSQRLYLNRADNAVDGAAPAAGNAGNPRVDTALRATQASADLVLAITAVGARRANIGAQMSALDAASNTIDSSIQSQDEARSLYQDTDYVKSSSELIQANRTTQAAISAIAQNNRVTDAILRAIEGA